MWVIYGQWRNGYVYCHFSNSYRRNNKFDYWNTLPGVTSLWLVPGTWED